MKSFGGLFEEIVGHENLSAAMLRAAAGKRHRAPVARFLRVAEAELSDLERDLREGSYEPGGYSCFRIRDPKPRTIHCAPFRDRVVHQAVCAVVAPILERRMIDDSFACRRGKGTHRAVLRARTMLRRRRYYLKADIRKYFESVPHARLLEVLFPLFRERTVRELLEKIVFSGAPRPGSGRGLPIGSLTSQWFANYYLDGLDHRALERWRPGGYVRYMDDFAFFSDEKTGLWETLKMAEAWLKEERGLELKEGSVRLAPREEGMAFLGLRIFPGCWRLRRRRFVSTRRLARRQEDLWRKGAIGDRDLARSAVSRCGLARWFGFKNVIPGKVEV